MPKHSLGYRVQHRVRTAIAMIVIALLVFAGSAFAATWNDIDTTVRSGSVKVVGQTKKDDTILDPFNGQPIELLVLGQDTREGDGNAAIGGTSAHLKNNHQADTTMVVQISADRSWINLVSIPRDSIVDAPSCETTTGTIPARQGVMFNSIFATGYAKGGDLASAASCTMTAVNALTGLNIQNFVVVDFQGLKNMIDAIGGVDICIPVDLQDKKTHLNLARGMQHLDGTTATQYARMRHGTGTDGSDIMRTTRQQYLIKQLLKEAMDKNLFTQSGQLYQLAKTALQSLNFSEGMADTAVLAGLAMSMRDMDTDNLFTQTVPIVPAPDNPNRVVWAPKAANVWTKLQAGEPLAEKKKSSKKKSETSGSSSSDTTNNQSDSSKNDNDNIDSGDTNASSGSTDGSTQTTTPKPDPVTGLITNEAGELIDPATGGRVDPESGSIIDLETGQYIGIANKYLNATVCAAPAN